MSGVILFFSGDIPNLETSDHRALMLTHESGLQTPDGRVRAPGFARRGTQGRQYQGDQRPP